VPTVDNAVENAVSAVQNVIGSSAALYPCGRLDACTSGLSVLAINSQAAKRVNEALQQDKVGGSAPVRKIYKALCLEPQSGAELPSGMVEHLFRRKSQSHANAKPTLLRSTSSSPSLASDEEGGVWQKARMVILRSSKVLIKVDGEGVVHAREAEIQLLTGRTHQIRLQLSALGWPIFGDTRYAPVAGLLDEGASQPHGDGSGLFGRDPRGRTGLHCSELTFDSRVLLGENANGATAAEATITLRATDPWWTE
jgi:23S rRNA-/tRNA-specific pseudouridylate synthase